MTIQSMKLIPYVNGVLSEDVLDITQICSIVPVPNRLYESKRLFRIVGYYALVCLKLYDNVDELNTAILEHNEFLLQIETDTMLSTFDHLTDATLYLDDDNYLRLFFAAPRSSIKIQDKSQKKTTITITMKEITVVNQQIVRKDNAFFKAVECRPRTPITGVGLNATIYPNEPSGNIRIVLYEHYFLDDFQLRESVFNLAIKADGKTYVFDKCHRCMVDRNDFWNLYMTVDKENINVDNYERD